MTRSSVSISTQCGSLCSALEESQRFQEERAKLEQEKLFIVAEKARLAMESQQLERRLREEEARNRKLAIPQRYIRLVCLSVNVSS